MSSTSIDTLIQLFLKHSEEVKNMLDVLSDNGDTKEKALVSKNIISGKGSTFNRDENAEDLPSKVKDGPVDVNKTYKIGSILAEAFYNFNKGKERDRYKESTKIAPKPQSRALERVNLPQKKLTRGGSESSGGLFDGIGSAIDSIQDIVDNVKSAKKLFSFTRKRGVKGLRRLASRKIGRSKVGRLAGSIKNLRKSPSSKIATKVAPRAVTKTTTKAVAATAGKTTTKAVAATAGKTTTKAVAATAGKVATTAVAATAGKAATSAVTKTAGKTLLKSGIKKIPFIGAAAGAIFAAQRAMQGDFLGAGLELVSGISSIVPGVGTAVSIAADAALAAKDINAASKAATVASKAASKTAAPVASKAASASKVIGKTAEKAAPKAAAVAATKLAGRATGALRVGSGVLSKVAAPLALAVDGVTAVTKLSTESGRANLRQQAEQLDYTKNFWGTLGKSILSPLETASAIGLSVKDLVVSTKDAKKSEENLKSQLESRGVASTEELYAKKQKEMLGRWDVNRDGILDKSEKLQRQLDLRSKRTAGNIDSGKVPVITPPSIQPNVTPMVPPKQEVVGKVDMPSVKPSTPIVDVNLNDQNSLIKQQTNVMLAILDVAKKQLLAKGGEASSVPPVINVSPQQPTRENVTFSNGRDIYLSSPYSLT